MHAKDVLCRGGEQAAVRYLEGCGFRILDRNWRCAEGEIDIVAIERQTFVVCEVKTRSGTRDGTSLEAVGSAKCRRLSGPLLNRVDVKVALQPVSRREMLHDRKFIETSAVVAQRVAVARERMTQGLGGTPWRFNAEIPGGELRRSFAPEAGALRSLDRAMELGQVTADGADKIVWVAWIVADLGGKSRPGSDEVSVAIALWLGVPR
jgi:predicted ATPase with chaperone activity